jgi:hypothetical protein
MRLGQELDDDESRVHPYQPTPEEGNVGSVQQ